MNPDAIWLRIFKMQSKIMSRGNLLQTNDRLRDIQNAFKAGNRKAIVEIISATTNDRGQPNSNCYWLSAKLQNRRGEISHYGDR